MSASVSSPTLMRTGGRPPSWIHARATASAVRWWWWSSAWRTAASPSRTPGSVEPANRVPRRPLGSEARLNVEDPTIGRLQTLRERSEGADEGNLIAQTTRPIGSSQTAQVARDQGEGADALRNASAIASAWSGDSGSSWMWRMRRRRKTPPRRFIRDTEASSVWPTIRPMPGDAASDGNRQPRWIFVIGDTRRRLTAEDFKVGDEVRHVLVRESIVGHSGAEGPAAGIDAHGDCPVDQDVVVSGPHRPGQVAGP